MNLDSGRAMPSVDRQTRVAGSMLIWISLSMMLAFDGWAATTVPTDIQQPGTQPGEVPTLDTPDKCDNCHGARNKGVELAHEWRGSMMAHASRDPLFWATMAVAEQDFDGSGDLWLRCHTTAGWIAGRSTPTDGSGLQQGDADGVECHLCHSMTNPDGGWLQTTDELSQFKKVMGFGVRIKADNIARHEWPICDELGFPRRLDYRDLGGASRAKRSETSQLLRVAKRAEGTAAPRDTGR